MNEQTATEQNQNRIKKKKNKFFNFQHELEAIENELYGTALKGSSLNEAEDGNGKSNCRNGSPIRTSQDRSPSRSPIPQIYYDNLHRTKLETCHDMWFGGAVVFSFAT